MNKNTAKKTVHKKTVLAETTSETQKKKFCNSAVPSIVLSSFLILSAIVLLSASNLCVDQLNYLRFVKSRIYYPVTGKMPLTEYEKLRRKGYNLILGVQKETNGSDFLLTINKDGLAQYTEFSGTEKKTQEKMLTEEQLDELKKITEAVDFFNIKEESQTPPETSSSSLYSLSIVMMPIDGSKDKTKSHSITCEENKCDELFLILKEKILRSINE